MMRACGSVVETRGSAWRWLSATASLAATVAATAGASGAVSPLASGCALLGGLQPRAADAGLSIHLSLQLRHQGARLRQLLLELGAAAKRSRARRRSKPHAVMRQAVEVDQPGCRQSHH